MNRFMYWWLHRWFDLRLDDHDFDEQTLKRRFHDWSERVLTWWFGINPLDSPFPLDHVRGMTPGQAFFASNAYYTFVQKANYREPVTISIHEWCLPMILELAGKCFIVEILPEEVWNKKDRRINVRVTPSMEVKWGLQLK